MAIKGGSSHACAVCKYQRRKCASDCLLAPYFPANQTQAFENAHRLFGVSNITKILKQLSTDEQKEEAMKSIKYESDMRERYPVYGCAGIICQLRQQLRQAIEELNYVYEQIAIYREQFNDHIASNPQHFYLPSHPQSAGSEVPLMMNYCSATTNEYDGKVHADSCAKPFMGLDHYYDLTKNKNSIGIQPQIAASNAFGVPQDYGDNICFNTMIDDRQSYVETKEACESSSESSLRDFPQSANQVSDSELRNAAACFSLTSMKLNE